MGLLKGGAIFGLGAVWGMFVARNNRDGREFRMRAHNNCPLKKKKKAQEMEKAKELENAKNSDESVNTQIPANFTLEKPNYQ